MKRLFALFLVLLLIPAISFSDDGDPIYISKHYSLFVDGRHSVGKDANFFDFDSLCVDLYMVEGNEKAYLSVAKSFLGIFADSGSLAVTVKEKDGILYFVSSDGNLTTGYYDENGEDLWLDVAGHTFRLRPVEPFSIYDDWK